MINDGSPLTAKQAATKWGGAALRSGYVPRRSGDGVEDAPSSRHFAAEQAVKK